MAELIYDAIVVGGGPAGLNAALVLARACRRILVVDAGHPRNEASRRVNGFLSRDGIPPCELRAAGQQELARYACGILEDLVLSARNISRRNPANFATLFEVSTEQGRKFSGRKLLLATGMRDKLPDFPGVRECYGKSIHHCPYCDGWEHRDQVIAAYGEDLAKGIGLARLLRGWSAQITVLSNGQPIEDEDRRRLAAYNIKWAEERIDCFTHHQGELESIQLHGGSSLRASALFFNTPQHSCCDFASALGAECDDEFAGRTSRKQKTNVPGLFIAGDADGEVQFAIVAAAEGATAAVAINRELQDEDLA